MALTPEQQAAVDTRDKTLLVSAAAGSGKTVSLIQKRFNFTFAVRCESLKDDNASDHSSRKEK